MDPDHWVPHGSPVGTQFTNRYHFLSTVVTQFDDGYHLVSMLGTQFDGVYHLVPTVGVKSNLRSKTYVPKVIITLALSDLA